MWRPKDGFERRFEIQRKEDYEKEEKEREREGENYQGTYSMSKTKWSGMVGGTERSDALHVTQGQTDPLIVWATGVRWRRSRMSSGSGPEESERGHRGRNTELRRSISDMNLSLRRRQGNHVSNDPHGSGRQPNNNGGMQDRKNIVSMINPQHGEVRKMF